MYIFHTSWHILHTYSDGNAFCNIWKINILSARALISLQGLLREECSLLSPSPNFLFGGLPPFSCTSTHPPLISLAGQERISQNLLLMNNYLVTGSWQFRPVMSSPHPQSSPTVHWESLSRGFGGGGQRADSNKHPNGGWWQNWVPPSSNCVL